MSEETDYPDAREYYPNGIKCRYCGKKCYGIEAGLYNPLDICNECAVPIKYYSGDRGCGFVRDADGSVSYA